MRIVPLLRSRAARPLAALALTLLAGSAQAQRCAEGMPRTATLGIGLLQCVGGSCTVNVRRGDGYTHDFSTEPHVWELDPSGPAARVLREGDQLLAIDGVLITTPSGGRRLASLRAGVPVRLRIRRDDAEMEVRVVPAAGCNTPRLAVTARHGHPEVSARPHPAPRVSGSGESGPGVYFGMELECGDCGWRVENGDWRWHATEPIRVRSVVAGSPAQRAGLRPGDVLMRIDGRPLTQPGAGGLYASLRPGQPVSFQVRRGDRTLTVPVVPQITRRM